MKDLILILVLLAFFIFGYFTMKKLDRFLRGQSRQPEEASPASALRIALEDPAIIDAMEDLFRHFSAGNPQCSLYLFYGSANEIQKKLKDGNLDFGLILEAHGNALDAGILSLSFPAEQGALSARLSGASLLPLCEKKEQLRAIWRAGNHNPYQEIFVENLKNHFQKAMLCPTGIDGKRKNNVL